MKKLEKVYLPELLEVKMQMQKRKRAAYQEAMLDMLEPEKNEWITRSVKLSLIHISEPTRPY